MRKQSKSEILARKLSWCVLTVLLLFVSFDAFALQLYTWKPHANYPEFVIAVREGESAEAAAIRYLSALKTSSDLSSLVQGYTNLETKNFKQLGDEDLSSRALLIINDPKDFQPGSLLETFSLPLKTSGNTPYALPLALDIGLEPAESAELIESLNHRFGHFIAMGGADIDPRIYGELLTYSSNVNARRDRFESALLSRKIQQIKIAPVGHSITGVCRGAQLTAALLGYKLGQDIPLLVGGQLDHGPNSPMKLAGEPAHPVQLMSTSKPFLKAWFKSDEIVVNTYHHQYVQFHAGGPLELGAVAADGIPEALISKDGRIRLFQFHPELMRASDSKEMIAMGTRILNEVFTSARIEMQSRAAVKSTGNVQAARPHQCSSALSFGSGH